MKNVKDDSSISIKDTEGFCSYIWLNSEFKESYNNEALLISWNLLNNNIHKNKCLLLELNAYQTFKKCPHISILFSFLGFPIYIFGEIVFS